MEMVSSGFLNTSSEDSLDEVLLFSNTPSLITLWHKYLHPCYTLSQFLVGCTLSWICLEGELMLVLSGTLVVLVDTCSVIL